MATSKIVVSLNVELSSVRLAKGDARSDVEAILVEDGRTSATMRSADGYVKYAVTVNGVQVGHVFKTDIRREKVFGPRNHRIPGKLVTKWMFRAEGGKWDSEPFGPNTRGNAVVQLVAEAQRDGLIQVG